MRLVAIAIALLALVAALWAFVPRARVGPVAYEPAMQGGDLDAWLAAREGAVEGLEPGTEKRIVWAGVPGVASAIALVYLHGFSATSAEIRPVPERVARALGANLFLTRLTGHGLDGAALGRATAEDWLRDTAEAVEIGQRIGRRVVVIGTSTGGTLAVLAATDPALAPLIDALVLVSPNFGLASRAGQTLLDAPFAEVWGRWLPDDLLGFEPRNDAHARFWTERYPAEAALAMAALVRSVRARDPAAARVPVLFVFSRADRVVSAAATEAVAAAWGGPATVALQQPGPGDDPFAHVIAGDILSPGRTDAVAATMTAWLRATLELPEETPVTSDAP